MVFAFRGGLHLAEENKLTAGKTVEKLPLPKLLYVHTCQHIGAPTTPIVSKGEAVKKGQPIAKAEAFVSAPVHAPTSGVVEDIVEKTHPTQGKGMAILIAPDGRDEWASGLPKTCDWRAMDDAAIRQALKDAGVVGLGGAAFPTHVKLTPPPGTMIDTVLVNGVECEPYLTSDDAGMCSRPEDIVTGMEICVRLTGAKACAIGIEENKPNAVELLTRAAQRVPNCRVVALPARYPQGAERSIIKAILDRWVPAGQLPMSVGVVVQNTSTCIAIADAVTRGIPLVERIVTVSGSAVNNPKNILAPIGATWRDLFDFCGGLSGEIGRLVMGGPMMGIAQNNFDTPMVKGTSGLLAFTKEDVPHGEEGPCIRCGRCLGVCPMGLMPNQFPAFHKRNLWEQALAAHVVDCVECGVCEYSCPAGRHILQPVKLLKAKIREMQAKKQKAPKPK